MARLDHDLDPPDIETGTRFGRRLAIAVAVVGLAASACAAGSAIADSEADRMRRPAQQQAIEAVAARTTALAKLYDTRSRAAQHEELAVRRNTAALEDTLLGQTELAAESKAWTQAVQSLPPTGTWTLERLNERAAELLARADGTDP